MEKKPARQWGGTRPGAGQPRKAPTEVVRLPHDVAVVARRMAEAYHGSGSGIGGFMRGEVRTHATVPLVSSSVACGFPSPAEDHLEGRLDMNEFHNIGGTSTFMVRVVGESMRDAGMLPGDVVVVDLSLAQEVRHGAIVVACLNGEFTLKRYLRKRGRIVLHPENPAFPDIEVPEEAEFQVWGVVTSMARSYKP